MMDSSKEKHEPESTKKIKSDDLQDEGAQNDLPVMPELGLDELCMILNNYWISAEDLLKCRLVNRTWRLAASTILNRRNVFYVELTLDDGNQVQPCFYKHGGKKTMENSLTQLTDLMSDSKMFPATKFRIRISSDSNTSYTEYPDLLLFFKLHEDKIKTLGPSHKITSKLLLDILCIYTPSLECLDLREAEFMPSNKEDDDKTHNLKAFTIKSLTVGDIQDSFNMVAGTTNDDGYLHNSKTTGLEILHLLLSTTPCKLSCIDDVTLNTLEVVLTEGKGHLIRSFTYDLSDSYESPSSIMTKFIAVNPKLSAVTLDLEYGDFPRPEYLTSLNAFIQSFKGTVLHLALFFHSDCNTHAWNPLLAIPPMTKLKSLTLIEMFGPGDSSVSLDTSHHEEYDAIVIDLRKRIFHFESGISAQNYFPSLKEVSLSFMNPPLGQASLISFFAFKTEKDGSVFDSYPKVDVLKINGSRYGDSSSSQNRIFSTIFPNVRILKIKSGDVENISSSWWSAICPKAEFIEIYGISNYSSHESDIEMRILADIVFTGFSSETLQKLRTTDEPLHEVDHSSGLEYLPERPSVCNLGHLKELKLNFLGSVFTFVTGVHTLSIMPNTKFIMTYDPEIIFSSKDGTENEDGDSDGVEDDIESDDADAEVDDSEDSYGDGGSDEVDIQVSDDEDENYENDEDKNDEADDGVGVATVKKAC